MTIELLLVPDIGDFENVEVIEILVKPGDQIKENDPIVTIESDKSSVEIPSTIAGKVDSLAVKVGDKVLFGKWSGTEVKINGKEYSIMKESDIMGISGK